MINSIDNVDLKHQRRNVKTECPQNECRWDTRSTMYQVNAVSPSGTTWKWSVLPTYVTGFSSFCRTASFFNDAQACARFGSAMRIKRI